MRSGMITTFPDPLSLEPEFNPQTQNPKPEYIDMPLDLCNMAVWIVAGAKSLQNKPMKLF